MRLHPSQLPLALFPLILPALAEEGQASAPPPTAAKDCERRADESMKATSRVDAALRKLEAEPAPALTSAADAPMPEARAGESVIDCDGGLFFDTANSQLVYLGNVRLSDSRVELRASNRLYIQLPKDSEKKGAAPAAPAAPASPEPPAQPAPGQEQPKAEPAQPAPEEPATESTRPASEPEEPAPEPAVESPLPMPTAEPLKAFVGDAFVDSVANRILFTTAPGTTELSFRQGNNSILLSQAKEGEAAFSRALADEAGNILLEAPVIHMRWQAEDGTFTEFRSAGGRTLYHAASHALVMEGPVEASYRDGESTLHCSGPLCVALKPEEGAPPRKSGGFMAQFTSMRFSGIASASATGNVQFASSANGEGIALSGDALYYNGLTGEIEVPGTPCIISYGEGGRNTMQTEGSLLLAANGDIHFKGKGNIEGVYERPAREEGGAPLRGTLSARPPLIFHAETGTVTTSALNCRDAESSISCTGDVLVTLAPRADGKEPPPREKTGMVNTAISRYDGISAVKAAGQVRGQLLDPASTSGTPEATVTASHLDANLITGEMRLIGQHEPAAISFQGYSLSGTADAQTPASIHLKPNGDIEVRGKQVACAMPNKNGVTTVTSTDRMLLAREPRSLSLGAGTRIQSPDGIITTNGPLQAVLAPSAQPGGAKPLSPRYPHLVYDFSGLDSAETFSGATVRTSQGSMQCTQHLSVLMLPQGSDEEKKSNLGGLRSAIATGQVLIAAKDGSGRVVRAAGDRLEINGLSGEKKLTGTKVVLEDARNRHEASGAGAAVIIDARNNARVTGARHSTYASGVRKQVEENDSKNQKQDNKPN